MRTCWTENLCRHNKAEESRYWIIPYDTLLNISPDRYWFVINTPRIIHSVTAYFVKQSVKKKAENSSWHPKCRHLPCRRSNHHHRQNIVFFSFKWNSKQHVVSSISLLTEFRHHSKFIGTPAAFLIQSFTKLLTNPLVLTCTLSPTLLKVLCECCPHVSSIANKET